MNKCNSNREKYFYLFSNCILVDGFKRSSIIDVQRRRIHFVPNELYHILKKFRNKNLGWIKEYFNENPILDGYYEYLLKEELGVFVDSLNSFPNIDLTYRSPSSITNAVIEVSDDSDFNFSDIFMQLSEMNCESLELRFLSAINLSDLSKILEEVSLSTFRSIVLGIPYSRDYTTDSISLNVLDKYLRVNRVHVYGCENSEVVRDQFNEPVIVFSKQKSLIAESCGKVSPDYFSPCLEMVCESMSYNTCLHKKVCITSDGKIRNCPAMSVWFGDTKTDSLKSAVDNDEFKKIWSVKKDDIEVCKDCEMRYVCHDCRAFITNPENIFSKPLKCSYNPYEAKWES
jgi:Predicted Fe-S oxidoreductases